MEHEDGATALKKGIEARFNRMYDPVLSVVELLSKNDFQYTAARKKLLRAFNDSLRKILSDVDSYEITPKGDEGLDMYRVDGRVED